MTIATTTQRVEYTATAAQTTFAYAFYIQDGSELNVYVNGVLKTLTTHYTVTGAGAESGGNVVFGTGLTVGDSVVIVRLTPKTQATNYVENDKFPAASHEAALDKLTRICQDHLEVLERCIRFNKYVTYRNWTMPTIEANKVLRINSAADGLELVSFTASDIGSPISSKGDIIYGDVAGVPERLAIGTVGQILRVAGGVPTWDDDDAATYAVVTTKGDLIVGNAGGAPARLAIGSTGQVLTVAGATATWAANPVNVITTRGDIIVGNSTPIPARLAAGTEGDRLTVNSSGDVVWVGLRSTAARVYRSTDQTITKNTYTKVEAAHETFDYGANYDAVTNYLYTAPVAGVYLVIGQVCWQTVTGAGVYRALIYVDGVAVRESFELLEAADNRYVQVQDLIALTAGQTVGLYCHTNSASNEDVNGGSAATWMSVIRVA